jgi:hypothetical protein
MLHAVFSFEFRIPHSAFGTANFFMDDLPYPLCSKLPGLKQEMGPPVPHIRDTMSGEAAIEHIFAVLWTAEPRFESLPAGFWTKRDILCHC